MPSVQVIPASDSYRYEPPSFDDYQFQKRFKKTLALTFSDFHNMHVERRKEVQERRLPTPAWALNDLMLRELVVRYMERRAFLNKPQAGTLKERLDRAERAVAAQAPRLQATLKELLNEYVALKKPRCSVGHKVVQGGRCKWHHAALAEPTDQLRKLEVEIQNVDKQLCIIRKGVAATVVSIIYLYYRVGFEAVDVAEQLGLTVTHIHRLLWSLARLERVATRACHRATARL